MYNFFKSEIRVNIIILIIGVFMVVLSSFLGEMWEWQPILMGIGCSVIASSMVAFLTQLYREKEANITNTAINAGLVSENNQFDIIDSMTKAKKSIDIMSKMPVRLIKDNIEILKQKVQSGVRIRILFEYNVANENVDETERMLRMELADCLKHLKRQAPLVEVRYIGLITGRLFNIDDIIYASFFQVNKATRDQTVFMINKETSAYDSFSYYFEVNWQNAIALSDI